MEASNIQQAKFGEEKKLPEEEAFYGYVCGNS
jgi:hypothetical protein